MSGRNDWWRGAVVYQVYPRSFNDSNADGIGDIKGITAKLDYIASLGVDAVWLSPFFTSPMVDFGYDVSDYKNVDPMFGTLGDFDEMLAEMHKRGLKLIIDVVPGRGGMFSLDNGREKRFLTRSTVCAI